MTFTDLYSQEMSTRRPKSRSIELAGYFDQLPEVLSVDASAFFVQTRGLALTATTCDLAPLLSAIYP